VLSELELRVEKCLGEQREDVEETEKLEKRNWEQVEHEAGDQLAYDPPPALEVQTRKG